MDLRERCAARFPAGAFTIDARAWAARARSLDVEADVQDVAVLDDVGLAL